MRIDAAMPPARSHIRALDGLRGLAILMVMVHHFAGGIDHAARGLGAAMVARFTGIGWCGVDLFFVLSGFLITGILYDTKGSPGALRNFYARRVLRIFPLYYGLLLAVFVLLPVPGARQVGRNQAWLWLYASNIGTFFAHGEEIFRGGLVQMGHFWSLAVEEQFYLAWPIFVLWLSRETLMKVCGGVILAVVTTRLTLIGMSFEKIAFFTPCRVDGLMTGAFLALAVRGEINIQALVRAGKWVAFGSGIILAAVWAVRGLDPEDWPMATLGLTLLAFFFGGVLLMAIKPGARTAAVFEAKWLRFLGKYSYGLYVFHFALMPAFARWFGVDVLTRIFHHYWPARLLYIGISTAASIVVALLSWHLFEKQFLKLKRFFEYRAIDPAATPILPLELAKAA
jgi:peptidoglycan/LPS O-acetylase OafA/YrhL